MIVVLVLVRGVVLVVVILEGVVVVGLVVVVVWSHVVRPERSVSVLDMTTDLTVW